MLDHQAARGLREGPHPPGPLSAFETVHPPCGTHVRDDLPDGYPVEEGVGLWCPVCAVAWWTADAAEAPASPQPSPAPPPPPPPSDPKSTSCGQDDTNSTSLPPDDPPAEQRRGRLALVVAVAVCVLMAVVVALTTSTSPDEPPAAIATTTPSPTAVATVPPMPTPPPDRVVAWRSASLTVPAGWAVTRRPTGVTARRPDGAAVRISVGPRLGRSLAQLGRDARRSLRRSSDAPLRRTRVGDRPAYTITLARQALTITAVGRRRWLISRPAGAGVRVARSVRIGR